MLLKKYFWLINLGLVALLAWVASDFAATLLSGRLGSRHLSSSSRAASLNARKSRPPGFAAYRSIIERNMFNPGSRIEVSGEPLSASARRSGGGKGQPVPPKSTLKLSLRGTVVSENPAHSYAVIRDDAHGGKQKLLQVGNRIQGAKIVEIHWGSVILEQGGQRERLTMVSEQRKGEGRRRLPRALSPSNEASVVQRLSADTYVVDREAVQDMIGNVNQFMTQLRIRPYFVNGQPVGYLISDVRPGSVVDRLGIRNGDVVKSVNGMPITRPEQAFAAYKQLQDESELTLEIQRGSRTQVLTYQIR